MIVFGHKALPYPQFKHIENIEDIKETNANEILYFHPNPTLAKHCQENGIAYAIFANNIIDLVIYANLNAKYILIKEKHLVENAQKIANEYFFDSKILYIINDESSIENAAMLGIDGVIFQQIIQ